VRYVPPLLPVHSEPTTHETCIYNVEREREREREIDRSGCFLIFSRLSFGCALVSQGMNNLHGAACFSTVSCNISYTDRAFYKWFTQDLLNRIDQLLSGQTMPHCPICTSVFKQIKSRILRQTFWCISHQFTMMRRRGRQCSVLWNSCTWKL
jgi:hypothetical protein